METPVKAYAFFNLEIGEPNIFVKKMRSLLGIKKEPYDVVKKLKKIPHVSDALLTYGIYDGFTLIEAPNKSEAKKTIRRIKGGGYGVRSAMSLVFEMGKDGNPVGFKKSPTGEIAYCHQSLKESPMG